MQSDEIFVVVFSFHPWWDVCPSRGVLGTVRSLISNANTFETAFECYGHCQIDSVSKMTDGDSPTRPCFSLFVTWHCVNNILIFVVALLVPFPVGGWLALAIQLVSQQRENNNASTAAASSVHYHYAPPLPLKLFTASRSHDSSRQRPPPSTAPGKSAHINNLIE